MNSLGSPENTALDIDIVIIGGGIAGLWLLSRLRQAGYNTLLLEKQALGAGQTRYSQGIIHGGTKYALTGKLTASSESIYAMPAIWRDCLQGKGEVDLSTAQVLSEYQYMWSTPSLLSRLSGFFASRVVRGRMQAIPRDQYPPVFQHKRFRGKVYRLDEPVLDAGSVVKALATPHLSHIMHVGNIEPVGNSVLNVSDADGKHWQIRSKKIILAAGEGNAALLAQFGQATPQMQRRPLQMVMVRGGLPGALYAHCLGASVNPRITITSGKDSEGEVVWYLGGQLAEEGVGRSREQQIDKAKRELQVLMPWLDFAAMQWATLMIERAEVKQPDGQRPASSFCTEHDNIITTWPTKLALAPNLANDVLALLQQQAITKTGNTAMPAFAHATFAPLPWQEEDKWKNDN